MESLTGIGRPIDLRFRSNRTAVGATLLAATVGFVAGSPPISTAIALGGATFLGWALAREIDPDRPLTASLTAPLAAIAAWIDLGHGHGPSLGALYLTMLAARVIVRTSGRPPTVLDLGIHVVAVGWLSSTSLAWVAGVGLAVVVVLDTRLPARAPDRQLWLGGVLGLVATLAAGFLWDPPTWQIPTVGEWIPMVIGVTGAVFLTRFETPRSLDDAGAPIDAHRLAAGRLAVVLIAVVTALAGGAVGVGAMGAAWAALGVGGVVRILDQPS